MIENTHSTNEKIIVKNIKVIDDDATITMSHINDVYTFFSTSKLNIKTPLYTTKERYEAAILIKNIGDYQKEYRKYVARRLNMAFNIDGVTFRVNKIGDNLIIQAFDKNNVIIGVRHIYISPLVNFLILDKNITLSGKLIMQDKHKKMGHHETMFNIIDNIFSYTQVPEAYITDGNLAYNNEDKELSRMWIERASYVKLPKINNYEITKFRHLLAS